MTILLTSLSQNKDLPKRHSDPRFMEKKLFIAINKPLLDLNVFFCDSGRFLTSCGKTQASSNQVHSFYFHPRTNILVLP